MQVRLLVLAVCGGCDGCVGGLVLVMVMEMVMAMAMDGNGWRWMAMDGNGDGGGVEHGRSDGDAVGVEIPVAR